MGRSVQKKDLFGRPYTEHYDDDGKKTGESRERTDLLGRPYTEHRNSDGRKVGKSRERTDLLGRTYTEHRDANSRKTGKSRERTDILGREYTEHLDSEGRKTGKSREKTDFLGRRYTEHEGVSPSSISTLSKPSSVCNTLTNGDSEYSSNSAIAGGSASTSSAGDTGLSGTLIVIALLAIAAVGLTQECNLSIERSRSASVPSHQPSFGPGVPDLETWALVDTRPHYGPGSEFKAVGFEIPAGERAWVETVKNGWCMINSAEYMWVNCATLAEPVGGWIDVPGPLPPRGD